MDLIKNINETFQINQDFFKNSNYHLKSNEDCGSILGEIIDLSLSEVTVEITSIQNIDSYVDSIITSLILKLEKDVIKYKKISNKIIKAWRETPEMFKTKDRTGKYGEVFENKTLLSDNEYSISLNVFFFNYFSSGDFRFTSGYGEHSYYGVELYIDDLNEVDAWFEKIKKDLTSKKIKDRFIKYVLKHNIEIPLNKIYDVLTLSETSPIKPDRPVLPINIDGAILNGLFYQHGSNLEINKNIIQYVMSEHDVDLLPLLGWEIESYTDDYHHHDGQVCDYVITLSSPEGYEYYAYDEHCLMTGWNFDDGPAFE